MVLLILISAVLGTVLSNPTQPPLNCSFRNDGVYWWGCRAFQSCQNGRELLTSCVKGEAFNPDTYRCEPINNVPPPCGLELQCPTDKTGTHRYPELEGYPNPCGFFYTCQEGQFLGHQKCLEGTVFDEIAQLCNWPENVFPPCGIKVEENSYYN